MHRAPRSLPMLAFAFAVAGCELVGDLVHRPPSLVVSLEIHNRTQADLFYVAADGERLDVPACGTASDPDFDVGQVEVRTEEGYIRAFGAAAPEFGGQHLVLVEVSSAMDSGIPEPVPAPDPLPPCEGLPEVQVGI